MVNNETIVKQLNWRYATKKFDPGRKISDADWKTLEKAMILSPSSFGIEPWKFFVITNPQLRVKLRAVSWDQSQVTDASHLVVFAARKGLNQSDIDNFIGRIAEVRKVTRESLKGYSQMMENSLLPKSVEQLTHWATRQVYLALGMFLNTAAVLGIDACPMEGFDPAQYDQILGLEKLGYTAVVLATAGYRAGDDKYAQLPKVRFSADQVIVNLK